MRAALIALMLMIGSQAGAECGNLCDLIGGTLRLRLMCRLSWMAVQTSWRG